MNEMKPEHQVRADLQNKEYREQTIEAPRRPSSSSWQETISDTQAVTFSDYLLNEQATDEYFNGETTPERLTQFQGRETPETSEDTIYIYIRESRYPL